MKPSQNYYFAFALLIPLLFFTAKNALLTFSNSNNVNIGDDSKTVGTRIVDTEQLEANIAKILIKPTKGDPVLENYPFPLLNPPVYIAEGFDAYDGNLKDKPGAPHLAIDYVQKSGDHFLSFPVFSTHAGTAIQGVGASWGKFVIVRKRDEKSDHGYNTLYSHLTNIPKNIPFMSSDINNEINNNDAGIFLPASTYIGDAWTTGTTNSIPQLHFEMHEVDMKTGETFRIDPYGIYARLSSGKYPQVGSSLKGIPHYWTSNSPAFPNW